MHHGSKISVPVNLKEAGYWWTQVKNQARKEDNVKVTYRATRNSRMGPGWHDVKATGPGGDRFLEWALKELFRWRPESCQMIPRRRL